ncbi:arabinosyltransferase domain-containing protein [Pseudonocardia sp. GCM10023141]|uniref:arabinosyltransferase domain-containing protein n=1 Tax=Pseudonocardia sp. GCM10023141 TaxID=3252653 RepID=UPI003609B8E8
MLSPARSVPPPEPDAPQEPAGPGPIRPTARDPRRWVWVLGLIAVVAAVLFPFAPVEQPIVRYNWTAAQGPAAIPLMPYQPVELTATVGCAVALAGDEPGGPPSSAERVLLTTVPPRPDPAAQPLAGLRITTTGTHLHIASAGLDLGTVTLPNDSCVVTVQSDPARTTVLVDGAEVLHHDGDMRPDVAGAFTDETGGVSLALTTDTRFQTTISPLKLAIAAVGVLALLGMLVALRRVDRRVTAPVRLLPRRWWRPRPVDGAVALVLLGWWVIGAVTVDDGYIAGIVRSRGSNGFVGNVYRWLNAPEAPFSWFDELYYLWSLISPSTLWMRLPSTLLGLLCWGMLARLVLPRLGRFTAGRARRAAPWLLAMAFATWWVPLNLGLRPEPWVTVGALAVFVAVERALATRRVVPLIVGLLLAGVTTAVTPGGLMAFVPVFAAALPLLRMLRARTDLNLAALIAALVAAPAAAVFLMVSDQSLASMLEATRVRALIGGGAEWYQEYLRYSTLLESSFQGAIGRRAAVLLTLLAAAGVLWTLRKVRAGIATGPARRLVLGLLLMVAVMTATPTKWTQHFGDLAGYGAAVLALGMITFAATPLRDRPRRHVAGLAAVTGVGALVLAGQNTWPYVSNWFTPTFSTGVARLAGTPVATIAVVAGLAVVLVLLGRAAWLRSGGATAVPVPRVVPAPGPLVALLLILVLALQLGTFARIAITHRNTYTLASDAVATLGGNPCGLQRELSVETDPAAGLLPSRPGTGTRLLERPVDIGSRTLPGIAVAGTSDTAWFELDPAQRDGTLPVVVTTSGATRSGDVLAVEFGTGDRVLARTPVTVAAADPRDVRLMAPAGADSVRLAVDAPTAGPGSPALVSLPRVPRLTPMTDVLPPGTPAILDWPVAFAFPCLQPEPITLGTAGLAQWRVAPPQEDPSAGITYAPGFGGPFAAPRLLVTEQRMATYLSGDPVRDAAQLIRWVPVTDMTELQPVVTVHSVAGTHADGHARVPGLDPPG